MRRLRVASVVEGHGEVVALPILLRRAWMEFLGGEFIDVLKRVRCKRDRLISPNLGELERMLDLATKLLAAVSDETPELVMPLVDAEVDLACQLGPMLLERARTIRSDVDVTCIIANHCFETWFVAAAESLRQHLDLANDPTLPIEPEKDDLRKSWVAKRIRRAKYSETADQPRLASAMDLLECRAKSPSFDKLCRELEGRLHSSPSV